MLGHVGWRDDWLRSVFIALCLGSLWIGKFSGMGADKRWRNFDSFDIGPVSWSHRAIRRVLYLCSRLLWRFARVFNCLGILASHCLCDCRISTAFAGYLGAFIPSVGQSKWAEGGVAALLIWTLTSLNMRSVGAGATFQLVTTVLKLLPLLAIIALGLMAGTAENIPPFNPTDTPLFKVLTATALLTMWAFVGLEAGTVAAQDVVNPKRTIPRAIIAGTLTVTLVYIAATLAVMMLVPTEQLSVSKAPFVDAAARLGPWGAGLIAIGALISTAGSANGNILLGGQMPMAVALVRSSAPSFIDGLRAVDIGPPDFEKLTSEHHAYIAAMKEAGVQTEILPPLPDFPDSIFVEDPALTFPSGAILLRPGARSRRQEPTHISAALKDRFETVLQLPRSGFVEGGDVLRTPGKIMIGLSDRTNKEGAQDCSNA